MYSPYYKTPRLYLSGYLATGQPLPPDAMMEDVVGDYKEKTVTLEEFPFFAHPVKMASVHPCKHAPVMKSLLDRADAALKLRRDKLRRQQATAAAAAAGAGVTGLTADLGDLRLDDRNAADQQQQPGPAQPHPHAANDDWEEVQQHDLNNDDDDEVAIRVDQYLVVFLKVWVPHSKLLSSSPPPRPSAWRALTAPPPLRSSWPASRPASSTTSPWAFEPALSDSGGDEPRVEAAGPTDDRTDRPAI